MRAREGCLHPMTDQPNAWPTAFHGLTGHGRASLGSGCGSGTTPLPNFNIIYLLKIHATFWVLRWVRPDDGGMDCPVCEKRIKQGFTDCEQQKEQLQAKNQRLVLALTVLGTLAGREAVDYAIGLSESVEQIISKAEVEPPRPTSPASGVWSGGPTTVASSNAMDGFGSILSYVPPLTPALFEPDPYQVAADFAPSFTAGLDSPGLIVPDASPMMLFGLALQPPRKRKP
jgi:hypothetical protein